MKNEMGKLIRTWNVNRGPRGIIDMNMVRHCKKMLPIA